MVLQLGNLTCKFGTDEEASASASHACSSYLALYDTMCQDKVNLTCEKVHDTNGCDTTRDFSQC
jgi:hypothetical protein